MRVSRIILLNPLKGIHYNVTTKTYLPASVTLVSQCCELTELFISLIKKAYVGAQWGPKTLIESIHWKPSYNLNY